MPENFYQQTTEAPETPFDVSLRPPAFSEFIGQDKVKERVLLMLEAAKQRGDVLDHVLLSGPPGLGKTTLANLIANAAGTQMHTTSGPQIEKAGDLAGILTNIQKGDILFIDEIHRLHPAKIIASISSLIPALPPARSKSTSPASPSSAPPPAPAC